MVVHDTHVTGRRLSRTASSLLLTARLPFQQGQNPSVDTTGSPAPHPQPGIAADRSRLIDPDGLKAAVTKLENGPYAEDPWSKLVEVIMLGQAARAFRP